MLVVVMVVSTGLGAGHADGTAAVGAAAGSGESVERLRRFEMALAQGANDMAIAPLVDAMLVEHVQTGEKAEVGPFYVGAGGVEGGGHEKTKFPKRKTHNWTTTACHEAHYQQLPNQLFNYPTDRPTDRPADHLTNQRTDRAPNSPLTRPRLFEKKKRRQ